MKKYLLLSTLSVTVLQAWSQNVAINATGAAANTAAMLDITSTTSGLLIPRMTTVQKLAISSPVQGLTVFDITTNSYWYHNGTIWVEMGLNNAWSLTGNAGTTAGTNFIGTTDAVDFVVKTSNTERVRVDASGNVGLSTTPTPSSVLDMSSVTTKGVEFPNVALSATNVATLSSPATGTVVYNTATAGTGTTAVAPGYYYWDGANWISMNTGGQSSTSYFSTGGLAITAATGLTYVTGYPVTVNIPANCTVLLTGDIGLITSSTLAAGFSAADVLLIVDGLVLSDGGYQRTMTMNNGGVGSTMQYASFSQAFTLSAGNHTFGIAGAGTGIGNNGTLGGNSSSVLQGELTVTIIKK
jgi:hypothetical protein